MATIYRFVIEQKVSQGGNGRKQNVGANKGSGKGKWVSLFGGEKGGVEHNRKMRAINPLLNKITGGAWEKGMRIGRAGAGLITKNTKTGAIGISGPAIAIIISFIIQTVLKLQNIQIEKARKMNTQNYAQLENGISSIRGSYKVSVNLWNGRYTYNENK